MQDSNRPNWGKMFTEMLAKMQNPPFEEVACQPKEPSTAEALAGLPLHEDLKAFYQQVGSFYMNGYCGEVTLNTFMPTPANQMHTNDFFEYNDDVDQTQVYVFAFNDEIIECVYFHHNSNVMHFITDGEMVPANMEFNAFMELWISVYFFRGISNVMRHYATGKEYTTTPSMFKDLIENEVVTNGDRIKEILATDLVVLQ